MNTVLIVDDETIVLKSIVNYLAHLGLQTIVTDNGNEALEMIKQNRPQLVFLDINIPGLKGIDVLRQANKYLQHSKIVVMTGHIEDELEKEALQSGAHSFLRKPFTVDDIKKILLELSIIKQ